MKMADILHNIADLLDASEESKPQQAPVVVNVNNSGASPAENDTETALDTDKFVPPLQQKIEIMKKLAGIDPKVAMVADEDEPFDG